MTTTAIFAEIIVIGLQVEAWLALYVIGLAPDGARVPDGLDKWVALITIGAVAAAYMLGVVMDRIADDFFMFTFGRAAGETPVPTHTFRTQRITVLHATGGLGKFLEYQRSRMRVARATAVNGAISLPAIVLFGEYADVRFVASIALLLLIVASAVSATKIKGAHESWLRDANTLFQDPRREP